MCNVRNIIIILSTVLFINSATAEGTERNSAPVIVRSSKISPAKNYVPAMSAEFVAKTKIETQKIISDAYFLLKEFEFSANYPEIKQQLKDARGVFIFPSLLKGGYIAGLAKGQGLFFARSSSGKWSYPSFYSYTQVSAGLQFGFSKSQVMMMVMNNNGMGAVIDDKLSFGISATGAVAYQGSTVGVSTTSNLSKDIITHAKDSGLFLGISLNGTYIKPNNAYSEIYYGTSDATTETVVIQGKYANPYTDKIRKLLNSYR